MYIFTNNNIQNCKNKLTEKTWYSNYSDQAQGPYIQQLFFGTMQLDLQANGISHTMGKGPLGHTMLTLKALISLCIHWSRLSLSAYGITAYCIIHWSIEQMSLSLLFAYVPKIHFSWPFSYMTHVEDWILIAQVGNEGRVTWVFMQTYLLEYSLLT